MKVLESIFPRLVVSNISKYYWKNSVNHDLSFHPQLDEECIIKHQFTYLVAKNIIRYHRQITIENYIKNRSKLFTELMKKFLYKGTWINANVNANANANVNAVQNFGFGQTITAQISRNGDLINKMYYQIRLPPMN